jgi:hypothetical protein
LEDLFDIIPKETEEVEEKSEKKAEEKEEKEEKSESFEYDFSAISDIIEQAEKAKLSDFSDEENPPEPQTEYDEDEYEDGEESEEFKNIIEMTENGSDVKGESKPLISKEKLVNIKGSIKGKIKDTGLLSSDMLKDMFFGSPTDVNQAYEEEQSEDEEAEETEPVLFDKNRKKRITADPEQDKKIFEAEYMLTPDQAADGYTLFYNEFVKPQNVKFSVAFGIIAAALLISALLSPKNYLNWLLLIISLSAIAMKWLNSYNAKKEAEYLADDVKNDSYKMTFYNSRILIEASELAGDKVYRYSPVMIRFEDIELKVIDYETLYVLIFKKDYIYTVPKDAMTEQMNSVFKNHLSNILGDDYREYYSKSTSAPEEEEPAETERE